MLLIIAIIWVAFGIFTYGAANAALHGYYPRSEPGPIPYIMALFGPIGLLIVAFTTDLEHPVRNAFKFGLRFYD